ncbi:MAG: hypothetical protein NT090_25510, partial [Acidobacteria bacterium]|nr:hypothetical protein [Acidobacteriota bacterium]
MLPKLTRRQLAASIAALPAARLPAQAPAPGEDLLKQARDQVRRNAGQLGERQIPMATEPAFFFKA